MSIINQDVGVVIVINLALILNQLSINLNYPHIERPL